MSWLTVTAFGFACVFAMTRASDKLDFFLIRGAAASFVGAGMIGASGWLGALFQTVTVLSLRLLDQFGAATLGSGVSQILIALVGVGWICAMLPNKWFHLDFPDWLVFGGFLLPALLVAVPGRLGEVLREVILPIGSGLNGFIASWWS